jgi:hypothetical protein
MMRAINLYARREGDVNTGRADFQAGSANAVRAIFLFRRAAP